MTVDDLLAAIGPNNGHLKLAFAASEYLPALSLEMLHLDAGDAPVLRLMPRDQSGDDLPAVMAERERLLPLLAHAVDEADGWHDDSRGGPIEDDPIMDAAREAARDVVRKGDGDGPARRGNRFDS